MKMTFCDRSQTGARRYFPTFASALDRYFLPDIPKRLFRRKTYQNVLLVTSDSYAKQKLTALQTSSPSFTLISVKDLNEAKEVLDKIDYAVVYQVSYGAGDKTLQALRKNKPGLEGMIVVDKAWLELHGGFDKIPRGECVAVYPEGLDTVNFSLGALHRIEEMSHTDKDKTDKWVFKR